MIKTKNIKRWHFIHEWSSLICTLFLLNLCITGLPLIFGEEINEWLEPVVTFEELPADTPLVNLDSIVKTAEQHYPSEHINYIYIDDDAPQIWMWMAPSLQLDDKQMHIMHFDSRTGRLLQDEPPASKKPQTFIGLMFSMHTDFFMGLWGELFFAVMGLLFILAIISGVVLYGPFMKKFDFGTVRYARPRLKWLDLHNLLGIVLTVWMFVVGVTGFINDLATPLFGLWQITDVKQMMDSYKDKQTPAQNELNSLQAAYDSVRKAVPNMEVTSVAYPGYQFGSPYHYLFWTRGDKPLTKALFTPVLIDGKSGHLDAIVEMPSYLRALEVSRPLHFGDYGGTPLKVLWVLFDVGAIIVLISGLYLWFAKRKSKNEWLQQISQNENGLQTEYV